MLPTSSGPRQGKMATDLPLIDATCSLESGPRIAFNDLATEWERSEQTGIAMLLKGMFSTFRNPTAHAPKVLWVAGRSTEVTHAGQDGDRGRSWTPAGNAVAAVCCCRQVKRPEATLAVGPKPTRVQCVGATARETCSRRV